MKKDRAMRLFFSWADVQEGGVFFYGKKGREEGTEVGSGVDELIG